MTVCQKDTNQGSETRSRIFAVHTETACAPVRIRSGQPSDTLSIGCPGPSLVEDLMTWRRRALAMSVCGRRLTLQGHFVSIES